MRLEFRSIGYLNCILTYINYDIIYADHRDYYNVNYQGIITFSYFCYSTLYRQKLTASLFNNLQNEDIVKDIPCNINFEISSY